MVLKEINQMDDRAAMGLPNNFQVSKIENCNKIISKLMNHSISALCQLIESSEVDCLTRFSVGQLLALYGDPRIDLHSPEMIEIPKGEMIIGIDEAKIDDVINTFPNIGLKREWLLKETPAFQCHVAAFRIRKYLVTNAEYRIFLLETQYPELPTSWLFGVYPTHASNHPVYSISETAAETFANWFSKKTKKHFRLPTEIEWETAASGFKHFQFPWGEQYKSDCANTLEEAIYQSTPVGMFPKGMSPFGVTDMAGNVEEYVADNYKPYPNGPYIQDDLAILNPTHRIARGGSFARYADLARTTRRHGRYNKAIYAMGFRLVEEI